VQQYWLWIFLRHWSEFLNGDGEGCMLAYRYCEREDRSAHLLRLARMCVDDPFWDVPYDEAS
jgi:hypothetical protein